MRERVDAATDYLRDEAIGGAALLIATAAALIWANVGGTYVSFWGTELTLGVGSASITEDLQHWVNDGLMALFFFVIALEVKRELVTGELHDRRTAAVPVLAALGGAALPILIFALLTLDGDGARGWAIPAATDIAFAVGVLALLGDRIPSGVKLLLLTIAVVDDVVAIALIALFYSSGISIAWLAVVAGGLVAILAMRALGVQRVVAYVPIGLIVWVAMLESGVHPTIAGVAVGLLTPAGPVGGRQVLEQLEHRLHPFSSLLVIPLFALANAGIAFDGPTISNAAESQVVWAIAIGLVVGKLLGIAATVLLVVRLGIGSLPDGVRPRHVWGLAALGGIGFTVSLFITELAYTDPTTIDAAKIGIFAGSLASALLGILILLARPRTRPRARSLQAVKSFLALPILGAVLLLAACGDDDDPPRAQTAIACDRFASPDGSDSDRGTKAAPFETVQKLADALSPGEVGCLRDGTYVADSDDDHDAVLTLSHGGSSDAPIAVAGYPGERATLEGTVTVSEGADDVTLTNLVFEGVGDSNTIKIYSEDVTVEYSEITNEGRGWSCMILGSNDGDGQAVRPVVRGNRFHDCGDLGNDNKDHGIYASNVTDGEIVDNVIHSSAAYAIQLYPNAQGTRFAHNVVDGGGRSIRGGIAFGGDDDYASADNLVERNVIAYSRTYNVTSSWDETVGSGNVAHDNCLWSGEAGDVLPDGGFTATDNETADPGFRDRADGDYRLDSDSPCLKTVGYDTAAKLSDAAAP